MPPPHAELDTDAAAQVDEERSQEGAEHIARQPGVPRTPVTEPIGQGQHPLAHGHLGEHALDQVGGCVRHSASTTGWTEATPFAGKGDQAVVAAGVAVNTQKAVREYAASEIGAEFAFDKPSYRRLPFVSASEEGLEVLSNDLVEQGLLRLVTLVLDGGSSPSGLCGGLGCTKVENRASSVPCVRAT